MGISKEERNWAMGAHLSSFLGSFIPFANIIAPLIVWLVKKDEMAFASAWNKRGQMQNIKIWLWDPWIVDSRPFILLHAGLILLYTGHGKSAR